MYKPFTGWQCCEIDTGLIRINEHRNILQTDIVYASLVDLPTVNKILWFASRITLNKIVQFQLLKYSVNTLYSTNNYSRLTIF